MIMLTSLAPSPMARVESCGFWLERGDRDCEKGVNGNITMDRMRETISSFCRGEVRHPINA